jgi:hypothetical protein
MIIFCSKCEEKFESLIIDRKLAMKELVTKSMDHVRKKHREVFELLAMGIQKASTNLACYMHFDECVMIPEDERFIIEQIDEAQDMVMMAVGFDPTEEEEEEDEPFEDDLEGEIPDVGEVELPEEIEDKEKV